MSLALRSLAGAVCVATAAAAAAAAEWQNVTVYRVTPMADEGVRNMNTADAAGDIYFGVSQLLLPYMCDGSSSVGIWCNNRKWLSGGSAWMVYRKFVIEARLPFGSYSPCNPDPATGVFSCGSFGGGGNQSLPKTCDKYHEHHSHYMNGSIYTTVDSIGAACDACTKDGDDCNSWRQLSPDKFGLMANGSEVAQVQGKFVVSGEKMGPHSGLSHCWTDNSATNVSFAPYCNRSNCTCDAYDKLSLGVETHAMCWDNGGGGHGPPPPPGGDNYRAWMSGLACLMDGNWYSTQAAGECTTEDPSEDCWWRLRSPTAGAAVVNATCADNRVNAGIRKMNTGCWDACGADADNVTSYCAVKCLFETILGNTTSGKKPTKEEVIAPFVDAFSPASEGGCGPP